MLEIADLTVSYGPVVALDAISAAVGEGEIVCLLGTNSAGKTTLIRTVMGLKDPDRGWVSCRGRDLPAGDVSGRVREGIAWVPEGRGMLGGMSVLDNLLMGGYALGDRRAVAAELERVLEIFPLLAGRRRQLAGTLSGGEQQMLAIGRALMCRPRILLMDEPSMGLAPIVVGQVFEIIAEINRRGVAILLVEQNAHMALAVAHRFYVLQKGRIVIGGRVTAGRLETSDGAARRTIDEAELESAFLGG